MRLCARVEEGRAKDYVDGRLTARLAFGCRMRSALIFLLMGGGFALAQLPIDSQLANEIAKIKAIDNHAHPVRPTWGSDKDTDFDALPVESMDPYTEPVRTRAGSPLALEASRALFGPSTNYKARRRQLME